MKFLLLIDKFNDFKWFITIAFIKIPKIINKKEKLQKVNNYNGKQI